MNQFSKINIFFLSALGAFAVVMGLAVTRGNYQKPAQGPPTESIIPFLDAGSNGRCRVSNAPCDVSSGVGCAAGDTCASFQRKAGTLEVKELYDPIGGALSTKIPAAQIVTEALEDGTYATAFCDPGYKLVGCSGARERNANYATCNEDDCEYTGAVPIVRCPSGTIGPADGEAATSTLCYDPTTFTQIFVPATGCRAGVDPGGPYYAVTVHAYCISGS